MESPGENSLDKDFSSLSQFNMVRVIREGKFNVVNLAVYKKTNTSFVIKTSNNNTEACHQLCQEAAILQMLKHKNIIEGYNLIKHTANISSLVLEYVRGENLHDKVFNSARYKGLGENMARNYFVQLLNAIAYLHSKSIVHRDIKPSNIIIGDHDHLRLLDFGFAEKLENGLLYRICGTPQFIAPEIVILGKPELGIERVEGYGAEVDMWALGITLYVMLHGCYPYRNCRTYEEMYKLIVRGEIDYKETYPDAQQALEKLLVVNPLKRITAGKALSLSWIS